ncbi:YtxH domain-containing protein [Paenibacillus sp. N3.4]|uniref:YtxH domain-containing protein n=1 Tax=Paenibacillus sp. N3.4 TaxID=2603222 RepID=UPI0011C9B17D|nr:YtxH domain-containing protein [Paenibacillus sp. N3.4]TXK86100.1 YtxH domain-containing protein [Paenibacillus sp. N3.4]
MSNETRGKDLLIGAVVGGLLGAATALLFAPKSGRELRGDIADHAQTVSDKTVQIASTVSQKTQDVARTVGEATSDLYGKAKDAAVTVVETVRSWKDVRTSDACAIDIEASEAAEDLVIVGNR